MKKEKIYEDENIILYSKKGIEHGYEAEAADSTFCAALIGYKTFASHLKEPMKFWEEVKFGNKELMEFAEEEIKKFN
jgi:hypothetical protein